MPINSETLNRQLYKRLSKYKPKPLDATGNVTPVEDEADVFKFTFSKGGKDYGTVFATVDDNHALTVYYSDDVTESPAGSTPDIGYDDSWTGLLKQLKSWAMHNQLSWQLKDRSHLEGDMARRNHMNKKDKIAEGYHAMGKSRSYSDNIPSVKIVIEHSRQIEEGEQRYRNINKIFLENQMGERFLLDTKKPGIARVYARHIAEGGKVNDDRWGHIQSLCEEYQKMAGFVRATRNGQFNESAQKLVNEAINHYQGLRESLSRMTGKRGYEAYFESWTPPLMEDETDTSNLNELFVQETLDPRIESVMPILSKLQKNLGEMKEVSALAEWADSLIEGEGGPEASEEPVDADMGNDTFGGEDGEDAPADDLSEEESLTSNNPIGIPEGEDQNPVAQAITRKILTQRSDLLKKYGPVAVMQAIDSAGEFFGDVEEIGSSDMYAYMQYVEKELGNIDEGIVDTLGKVFDKLGGGSDEDLIKDLQKKAGIPARAQHGKPNMAKPKDEEVDESALQAYLGDKKYGKDGMDALRKAGQEHASEKKMQNIRAKFSDKEKEVDEGVIGNMFNKAKNMFTKQAPAAAAPAPAAPVVPNAAAQARIAAAPQGYDPNTGKPQVAAQAAPGAVQKGGTMDMSKKVVAPVAKPAAAPAPAQSDYSPQELAQINKDLAAMNDIELNKAAVRTNLDPTVTAAVKAEVTRRKGVAEDLDANQKRVGQLGPTEKVKNNNIGKLVGANENFIGMAPQAVAEGLHPMIIADVEKLATLNPADRYSAYSNIRGYFKGDPELSKMAADLMGGYYEADMLRGKYKTAEAKAKYAELEPMNQAFIKRALGQEQTVAEGQEDLDTIKRLLGK